MSHSSNYGVTIEKSSDQQYLKIYDKNKIQSGRRLLDRISPSALSVDVTNICNLKCKHCFWSSYQAELPQKTDMTILTKVKNILNTLPSITNITWFGGEPLLNSTTKSIVKEGLKLRKNNLVITNACHEIPEWHREHSVHFAVSLDGTEKTHDFIRRLQDDFRTNEIDENSLNEIEKTLDVA
ncbi:MAG: 4Fe-4S cluster-binding domain-containing protein [bacterium]|nr:4Fe-4S cluster-binding domain-containing protein [bacterium]